jgi:hypothetical protein
MAQITINKRHIFIASFKADLPNAEVLAALARDAAALEHFGAKAVLNFPRREQAA